jgi:hypothetical protein
MVVFSLRPAASFPHEFITPAVINSPMLSPSPKWAAQLMGKQAFGFHEHQRYLATVRQEIFCLGPPMSNPQS